MFQEDQEHTVVLYTCGYCSRAFHQPKSNEQPGEDLKKTFVNRSTETNPFKLPTITLMQALPKQWYCSIPRCVMFHNFREFGNALIFCLLMEQACVTRRSLRFTSGSSFSEYLSTVLNSYFFHFVVNNNFYFYSDAIDHS